MRRVEVTPIDPRRLEPLVGGERLRSFLSAAEALTGRLDGRRLVNVNSTATGGGVAELLTTLVGYALGVGVECEWHVIDGDPEFFGITKRLHNGLYGSDGDGGELGAAERAAYEATVRRDADAIASADRALATLEESLPVKLEWTTRYWLSVQPREATQA